jgi:hypothetical protein
MPLRAMPHVGRPVVVAYLDSRVDGVISEVLDDGRRILVTTHEGERIFFVLNRATAAFTAERVRSGPRLIFERESDSE